MIIKSLWAGGLVSVVVVLAVILSGMPGAAALAPIAATYGLTLVAIIAGALLSLAIAATVDGEVHPSERVSRW